MPQGCIDDDEWEAAAYVLQWILDARWEVPAELQDLDALRRHVEAGGSPSWWEEYFDEDGQHVGKVSLHELDHVAMYKPVQGLAIYD